MNWLWFAARNTLRNGRRSAVTLAVAALGTSAVLLAGGFALQSYRALERASANDTGHLTLAHAQYFSSEEDTPLQHGIDHHTAVRARLLADPQIRQVLPRVQFSGLVSNGDKSVIMLGTGIDPAAELAVRGPFLNLRAGKLLPAAAAQAAPQVMLGSGLAQALNAAVGQGLTLLASTSEGALNAIDVQVCGIFTTGIEDIDKRLLYTNVGTAQQLLAADRVSTVGIYLQSLELTEPVRQRLAANFAPTFAIKTWREQAVFYEAVRNLYNRIFGTMGGIIAMIVLFVVANAMAMTIVERTRELGTLRALGTLPGQLIRMLALEGAVLGGDGALLGAAIAAATAIALRYADIEMPPPPGRTSGYPLQIALSASLYLYVVATIALLSTACAALIGRRTARKTIVEALTHV